MVINTTNKSSQLIEANSNEDDLHSPLGKSSLGACCHIYFPDDIENGWALANAVAQDDLLRTLSCSSSSGEEEEEEDSFSDLVSTSSSCCSSEDYYCLATDDDIEQQVALNEFDQSREKPAYHVRFPVDENGSVIVTEVYTIESIPEEFYPDVFWSPEEKREFRSEAKAEGYIFCFEHSEAADKLSNFYSSCGREEQFLGQNGYASSNDTLSSFNHQLQLHPVEFLTALRDWSNSDVRGLEHTIISNHPGTERKASVQVVLQFQQFLKHQQQYHQQQQLHYHIDELLREQSLILSARARDFAAKMALGDFMVAQQFIAQQ